MLRDTVHLAANRLEACSLAAAEFGWGFWLSAIAFSGLFGASIVILLRTRRRNAAHVREIATAIHRMGAGELNLGDSAVGPARLAPIARAVGTAGGELAGRFARLEDDRHRLRAVLSGMVEGVISIDGNEVVDFVNEQAADLLDISAAPAVGKKLGEICRHRQFNDIVHAALTSDSPQRKELDWEGPIDRRLAVTVARLKGFASNGAVVVVHDITELRRLERMRQEFVANVSHELKTPLAVIKLNVETLLDGAAADPENGMTFLEEINHQADRLHALILDLLRLARIESGGPDLEWDTVPLAALAAESIDRYAVRARAKNQILETVLLEHPYGVAAWADRESCETILDNLLDNAIRYTPDNGSIRIHLSRLGDRVRLEVEDTGVGIPAADQPHVFERFYRVDKARSRELGGTGLGLSIVKHLVGAMDGTVEVRSNPGRGTTFSVSLPAAEAGSAPPDIAGNLHESFTESAQHESMMAPS